VANKIIKLTLQSDLCPASGDGFAGFVDSDVCFLDNGLPYIPGKRLKGLLRECGLDIVAVDGSYSDVFTKLFGETGKPTAGELTVGNGKLENFAEIASSITPNIHRSEIAEVYTTVRSRTKMENGIAAAGTLRTARVLNKGEVFEFSISASDDTLDFLEKCVKSLRGMGLNRSRGLGEVKCELTNGENDTGVTFSDLNDYNGEKSFSYVLMLTEPVISADRSGKPFECENYIFGSAVLGAFAVKYIKKRGLDPNKGYLDETFRRLFLSDAVKFTAALPYKNGQVYSPATLSLKTNKIGDRLYDESIQLYDENSDEILKDALVRGDKKTVEHIKINPICKRYGGFVSVDENGVASKFLPEKSVFLHHARPSDKSKAHATSGEGEFYSYEALSEGQAFYGSVVGDEKDLRLLFDLFAESDDIKIGRSRTAQYGNAKISTAKGVAANSLRVQNGDTLRLVAVSPLILEDENGVNTTDLSVVAKTLGKDFEIIGKFCTETTVSGYYGRWLLAKTQSRAISESSVLVFKYNGSGTEIADGFMGLRSGEGFGQYKIERVPQSGAFELLESKEDKEAPTELSSESELGRKISNLRAGKAAAASGTKYGNEVKSRAPENASLTRIATSARVSANYAEFASKLLDIKQAKQQNLALLFVTNKWRDSGYFTTNEKHLEQRHIEELLEKCAKEIGGDYRVFVKHLLGAVNRIKQLRREKAGKEDAANEKV
jgi:CRISPR-associated protein Csx10